MCADKKPQLIDKKEKHRCWHVISVSVDRVSASALSNGEIANRESAVGTSGSKKLWKRFQPPTSPYHLNLHYSKNTLCHQINLQITHGTKRQVRNLKANVPENTLILAKKLPREVWNVWLEMEAIEICVRTISKHIETARSNGSSNERKPRGKRGGFHKETLRLSCMWYVICRFWKGCRGGCIGDEEEETF